MSTRTTVIAANENGASKNFREPIVARWSPLHFHLGRVQRIFVAYQFIRAKKLSVLSGMDSYKK